MSDRRDASAERRRVVICDDHPLFRVGLATALAKDPTLEIVAEASNAEEGIAALRDLAPDVLLLDIALPGRDGFAVLEWGQGRFPDLHVVVLSMYAERAFAERAKALGARAFIAKEDALGEIVAALAVPPGGFHTSESVGPADAHGAAAGLGLKAAALSPTERDIMRLLGQGLTSRMIGERLGISPRTVQTHRNNIADKLEVRGVNRLMEIAIRYSALFGG